MRLAPCGYSSARSRRSGQRLPCVKGAVTAKAVTEGLSGGHTRPYVFYRTSGGERRGDHWSPILRPHSFLSLFEKEKNRRGVRRSQLHCASAGAAKAPYPLAPSSFPKADRCAGSPFGYY